MLCLICDRAIPPTLTLLSSFFYSDLTHRHRSTPFFSKHKPLLPAMAGPGSSMVYSLLLFTVTLSLQEMYRVKLASSELFTILGGFISSLLFLFLLTFIGNFQETCGIRTGWGAVLIAEVVALIAAGTVHRVCITTCLLFSVALLYEVNKLSGVMLVKSESKAKRH